MNIDFIGGRGVVIDGPSAGRQEQSRIRHQSTHMFVTGAVCAPVGQVLPRPGVLGGVGLIFYGFPQMSRPGVLGESEFLYWVFRETCGWDSWT